MLNIKIEFNLVDHISSLVYLKKMLNIKIEFNLVDHISSLVYLNLDQVTYLNMFI